MRPKEYFNVELLEILKDLSRELEPQEQYDWIKVFYDMEKDSDITGIIKSFTFFQKYNFKLPGVTDEIMLKFKKILFNDAWFKKRCNDIKKKVIEQDFEN